MGVTTFYNEDDMVIEAIISGDIDHVHVLTLVEEMVNLTLKHQNHLWLVDYSNAIFKLGNFEIYNLPKEVGKKLKIFGNFGKDIKRAIIRVNNKEDFSFLYNVAIKEEQNMKMFDTRKEAVAWLNKIDNKKEAGIKSVLNTKNNTYKES